MASARRAAVLKNQRQLSEKKRKAEEETQKQLASFDDAVRKYRHTAAQEAAVRPGAERREPRLLLGRERPRVGRRAALRWIISGVDTGWT